MDVGVRPGACIGMAALLSLSACAGAPAADDGPTLRFVPPPGGAACVEADAPARVRRDAYGRPIHFREQRLDRHGVMRDVVPREADETGGREADCVDPERYPADDDRRRGARQR